MSPNHIFTYWDESTPPPIISLCWETIKKRYPSFRVYRPTDILSHPIWRKLFLKYQQLPRPQQSDLIRLLILQELGGLWLDADTICTQLISRPEEIESADLFGCYNPHQKGGWGAGGMLATPFGAKPNSPLISQAINLCTNCLDAMIKGEKVAYGQTSVGLLSHLYKHHQKSKQYKIIRREHWQLNRIPWYEARDVYLQPGSPQLHEASPHYTPFTSFYHLTNPIRKQFEKEPREVLLGRRLFLSWLLNKGLGRPPAIFGRSAEILARLSNGSPQIAEIGVYRGRNASYLLHQHQTINLLMVDTWGDHEQSYRTTGDHQLTHTTREWVGIKQEAINRTLFARDRRKILHPKDHQTIPLHSLDLIFIDGDHSYQGVKRDLRWVEKLKPGGWIGGHDYNHPKNKTGKYGVNRAVNEFAQSRGVKIEVGKDWVWFCQIP